MNNEPTLRRRVLNICLRAALALIVFAVVTAIYTQYALKSAEKQVQAFSQAVVIGMSLAGLEEKAGEMGLKFRRTTGNSDREGSIQAWQGAAFGRWFCDVEYRDGNVISKRVTFLD